MSLGFSGPGTSLLVSGKHTLVFLWGWCFLVLHLFWVVLTSSAPLPGMNMYFLPLATVIHSGMNTWPKWIWSSKTRGFLVLVGKREPSSYRRWYTVRTWVWGSRSYTASSGKTQWRIKPREYKAVLRNGGDKDLIAFCAHRSSHAWSYPCPLDFFVK